MDDQLRLSAAASGDEVKAITRASNSGRRVVWRMGVVPFSSGVDPSRRGVPDRAKMSAARWSAHYDMSMVIRLSVPSMKRPLAVCLAVASLSFGGAVAGRQSTVTSAPLTLWYRQPAAQWVEALPIGNGRLSAMVFGGVAEERLQLNEDTLWSGGPYNPANPDARAALPKVRAAPLRRRLHRCGRR